MNDKTIEVSVKHLKKLYKLLQRMEKSQIECGSIDYFDLVDCLLILEIYTFYDDDGKPKPIWGDE